MKTLLKNGLIADGSGKPLYKADVLLSGNVIEKIAENVVAEDRSLIAPGLSWLRALSTRTVTTTFSTTIRTPKNSIVRSFVRASPRR